MVSGMSHGHPIHMSFPKGNQKRIISWLRIRKVQQVPGLQCNGRRCPGGFNVLRSHWLRLLQDLLETILTDTAVDITGSERFTSEMAMERPHPSRRRELETVERRTADMERTSELISLGFSGQQQLLEHGTMGFILAKYT